MASISPLEISADPSRLDVGVIHGFLSTSHWALNRSRELVQRSIDNSVCVGAYISNRQVGFGRAVTDKAAFAYLADVFVLADVRGRGIGTAIVRALLDHPDLREVQQVLLRSRDAQRLYAKFGFAPHPCPSDIFVRYRSEPLPKKDASSP